MRTKAQFLRMGLALATVITVSMLTPTSPTYAAPSKPQPPAVQTGLTLVGFDATVAKEHGYKIVTYADGSQQSVPIDPNDRTRKPSLVLAASRGRVSPDTPITDTVYGDCGYSFIEATPETGHTVYIRSGFGILARLPIAVGYTWNVELDSLKPTQYMSWVGDPESRTWSGDGERQLYGFTTNEVIQPSDAILQDGSVCMSGDPGVYYYMPN